MTPLTGAMRAHRVLLILLWALACSMAGCGDSDGARGRADAQADRDASDEADADGDDASAEGDADSDASSADGGADTDAGSVTQDGSTTGPALTSIAVEAAASTLAVGTSVQLTATGIYADNTTADLTSKVVWTSSDASKVAFKSGAGMATALTNGQVTVSAQLYAITGTIQLSVSGATLVSLEVTPVVAGIASGTKLQFAATGTFSDATTQDLTAIASWTSSSAAVASVDSQGLVSGLSAGETSISASFAGATSSSTLKVSSATLMALTLSPATLTLAKGTEAQLSAIGTFSDNSNQDLTTQVAWASSDASVASVDGSTGTPGRVAALKPGSTTISATFGAVMGSLKVDVSAASLSAIVVTPVSASFAKGTTQQYLATGTYSDGSTQDLTTTAVWSSSDTAAVTVANQDGFQGLAQAIAPGVASISASVGTLSGTAQATVTQATLVSLAVSPALPVLAKSTTQQFTATGTYSDASTQDVTQLVAWASSSTTVAAISNATGSEGLATGLTAGESTISATLGAISASTTLKVTAATLTGINVTPVNPTIARGTTQAFVATGTYSDNTTQDLTTTVTWSSSAPAVATISNSAGLEGVATGLAQGQSTISATLGTTVGTSMLTVTPATLTTIAVTPDNATVAKGGSQQFTAKGTFSDGSVQDITTLVNWASSATNVATISNAARSAGMAVAVGAGDTTIRATRGSVMGSTVLHVNGATLVSIALTPLAASTARGTTVQYKAVGTYSDASTQDVTSSVTWSSSSNSTVMIGNALATKGQAVTLSAGMVTITATLGTVTASTTLTVTSATLVSIAVTPAAQTLAVGQMKQYTAMGTYSDGSTQNITSQVTWFSSKQKVASVSNLPASKGVVTAATPGETTIRAFALSGVMGETSVTVP